MELSPGKKFAVGVLAVFVLAYLLGFRVDSVYVLCPILLLLAMIFLGAKLSRNYGSARNPFRRFLGGTEFLCDDCKYNYHDVCFQRDRPNATRCPDYKRK